MYLYTIFCTAAFFNMQYIYLFKRHAPAVRVNDDDTASKLHHNKSTIWLLLVILEGLLIIWCVRRVNWKLTGIQTQVMLLATTPTVLVFGTRRTFRSQGCILV